MQQGSEALQKLQEGNARFVANQQLETSLNQRRVTTIEGQAPMAIILGCSDSRVPAELVFDQSLGDLFVIRVAGNIVAPSQIGSVEFAATQFGTPLVVVLGHTDCGAIKATLEQLNQPKANRSPNLSAIVGRIEPAVDALIREHAYQPEPTPHDQLMQQATRANIKASVRNLRNGSQIIRDLIQRKELMVVGAEYVLETGAVEFLHNLTG